MLFLFTWPHVIIVIWLVHNSMNGSFGRLALPNCQASSASHVSPTIANLVKQRVYSIGGVQRGRTMLPSRNIIPTSVRLLSLVCTTFFPAFAQRSLSSTRFLTYPHQLCPFNSLRLMFHLSDVYRRSQYCSGHV
jgi:hypothetical protein